MTPPATGPTRSSFSATEIDEVLAFRRRGYDGPLRLSTADQGRCCYRHERVEVAGTVRRDTITDTLDLGVEIGPMGVLLVCRLDQGRFERETRDGVQRYGPGDDFLVTEPDRGYAGRWSGTRAGFTMLDLDVLRGESGLDEQTAPPLRFTGLRPVDAGAALRWRRAVGYTFDSVLADPGAGPLAVGSAVRHLAATALGTFASTWAEAAPAGEAGPDTLRRAVVYVEEHAHLDIGIGEIAAAARATPRAVQYLFRQHLETTPTGFLRRVRLDRAHADLVAADPSSGATVTEIAMRWGFSHQGRFAASYKVAYGRPPRSTLQA